MITEMMFPNALIAIRIFRPLTPLPSPNTAVKNKLATVNLDEAMLALGTFTSIACQCIRSGMSSSIRSLTCRKICYVASNVKNSYNQKRYGSCLP